MVRTEQAAQADPAHTLPTPNLRRVYQAAIAAAGEDLVHLNLHGPHDLRHTFATWLEDAGVPSPVIDKLMGPASGRRNGGTGGSPMGRVYRETTPAMLTRVTAALDERISRAMGVAGSPLRDMDLHGAQERRTHWPGEPGWNWISHRVLFARRLLEPVS